MNTEKSKYYNRNYFRRKLNKNLYGDYDKEQLDLIHEMIDKQVDHNKSHLYVDNVDRGMIAELELRGFFVKEVINEDTKVSKKNLIIINW